MLTQAHHLLFVPEARETQRQVKHCGGVERPTWKLQRLQGKQKDKEQWKNIKHGTFGHILTNSTDYLMAHSRLNLTYILASFCPFRPRTETSFSATMVPIHVSVRQTDSTAGRGSFVYIALLNEGKSNMYFPEWSSNFSFSLHQLVKMYPKHPNGFNQRSSESICWESLTYFSLCGTVQHNRRPNNAVVTFVEVAVLQRVKVCEDEHGLEISVVSVSQLLDIVCDNAWCVDVLHRQKGRAEWKAGRTKVTTV